MNFKFTQTKTIVSIILGLAGGYAVPKDCFGVCPPNSDMYMFLLFAIISALLTYLIWSLIQKK